MSNENHSHKTLTEKKKTEEVRIPPQRPESKLTLTGTLEVGLAVLYI